MRKTDEATQPNTRWNNARDDEYVFVLLGRDAAAPDTIRFWARRRVKLGKNILADRQIQSALEDADRMDQLRGVHPGALQKLRAAIDAIGDSVNVPRERDAGLKYPPRAASPDENKRAPGLYWARLKNAPSQWTVVRIEEGGWCDALGCDAGVSPLEIGPQLTPYDAATSPDETTIQPDLGNLIESLVREMGTLDYEDAPKAVADRIAAAMRARPFDFLHGLGYRAGGASVTVNAPPSKQATEAARAALSYFLGYGYRTDGPVTIDVPAPDPVAIRPEFAVHPLNEPGLQAARAIDQVFSAALDLLDGVVPVGRQRSLMVTKLQEAAFWAERGVAVQEVNQAKPDEAPKETP